MTIHFSTQEFNDFRAWLNLNIDGLTWQGRFKKEFEVFWEAFFEDSLSLKLILERMSYAEIESKIGSLQSWFKWLKEKFICYVFINKQISIESLSIELGLSVRETAFILRNFFIDEYPHLEEKLSAFFSISDELSKNINLTFQDLEKELGLVRPSVGTKEEDVMLSMEVTLYDEWKVFVKKMKHDFHTEEFSLKRTSENIRFVKTIKIFQEVSILILSFILIVYTVKEINYRYEKFLIEKVSIFEPKFNWLSRNILFKSSELKSNKEFKLNFDEIPDISKSEKVTEFFDPEKYEEETEVTLTNFDSIPKDFENADREQSQYEVDDENPNGLRETKNGKVKTYRVMLTSANINEMKGYMSGVTRKYEVDTVGDSSFGMNVPGGIYYNLQVPLKNLKGFLGETMRDGRGKIFESHTSNVKVSPGKTRVFIMVKSI